MHDSVQSFYVIWSEVEQGQNPVELLFHSEDKTLDKSWTIEGSSKIAAGK